MNDVQCIQCISIGAKYDNFSVPDCILFRIMFTLLAKPTKNSTIFPAGSSILPSTAPTLPRVKNKVVSASGLTFLSKATSWNYLEKKTREIMWFSSNDQTGKSMYLRLNPKIMTSIFIKNHNTIFSSHKIFPNK